MQVTMIIVHHLGVSQSERIVWLFEELGLPYELKRYERDPVTKLAPPEYRKLHPIGIAPIITDGQVVLPESGAIVEYVIRKYGNGRLSIGPEAENFADYLFWFHFANGTLMPSEMMGMVASMAPQPSNHPAVASLLDRSRRAHELCEARLAIVPYLAGSEFTAADIMMGFVLTTMRAFTGREISNYPSIQAYLGRIGERPAYRRAMGKGDPGMTPNLR
jgi:glutathione S-transferase